MCNQTPLLVLKHLPNTPFSHILRMQLSHLSEKIIDFQIRLKMFELTAHGQGKKNWLGTVHLKWNPFERFPFC